MAKFIIQPHGRLQEMVAHELGFFTEEGLDYEITGGAIAERTKPVDASGQIVEIMSGAYQSYEKGKGNKGEKSDISCACHWTVNNAAANKFGTMYGKAYVVTPGGIMVPEDSPIRRPEDLAGQEIAVGYQSGSHYSTIQAVEAFVDPADIKLKFVGTPWQRVDVAVERDLPAASLWGLTYLAGEQLGLRKVADCTFMITFMFPEGVAIDDVEKYMRALKKAQMEVDLRPELYKHHFRDMIPQRYRDRVDVRRFAVGERIVFLPYTEQTFQRTQAWIHERGIFDHAPERVDYHLAVAAAE
jgi:ABC-type nitrate/sulfonate/bicarbonate transport system substrate-binding protein